MTRRTWSLVLMLLAAALLATCGGASDEPSSKAEYERELRATMDDLEAAYGEAGSAIEPGAGSTRSVGEIVDDLRASQVALRDAGNRLDELTPPEELADTHAELVAGVRDMADAVDLLIEAQESAEQDPARARQLARRFVTDESFDRVQAAAAELSDAGVDAGL